ncbi:MAG: CoA transferase, partial [Actinobacteria bacterium]|nr:CoA transferase [Actinomycetota bacterium]NIS36593.1 CoA transferase [Actinomycetota bacterium]NIT98792.1 CoA transferase [Actinomycetota bacterium]NIU22417.1 CoA transferase [Actinomycetota bacterium]NIU71082.1 CoA transferase [Actinomycetota bacterium]
PELADDPRFATRDARLSRREEVDTLVADWMATRTVAEAAQALSAADLPA